MVRALVVAGAIAIVAMVSLAAMPTPVPGSGRLGGLAPLVHQPPQDARPATLTGQVHDSAGTTWVGAVVEAFHDATGWRALALTDRDGVFVMQNVPVGTIRLVVRKGPREFTQVVTTTTGTTRVVVQETSESERSADVAAAPGGHWSGGGVPALAPRAMPATPVASMPSRQMQSAMSAEVLGGGPLPTSGEAYARVDPSGYRRVADAPLSTFSIDVDTASYANARRFLMEGDLPPLDAVRIEEWINYFPYAYPQPPAGEAFGVSTALAPCPWKPSHQLLRVGVRGRTVDAERTPARNLVFLVDVSGSMMPRDRLPLVRQALRMLVDELTARDRIALVVYAGSSGLVLPSTPGDQKTRIHEALARLEAGGSTNGAGGIQLAYRTAREGFVKGGVNRVVLATDGDFNVGVTSLGELTRLIEEERASGVFLSVLGVGRGNLQDATLEQLADRGNGNYAYLDSLQEARRVLIDQIGATLVTIASDVKLQVEFNPRHVAAYRLIGYENRALQTGDFADDRKDAGEIGAGHTVTALYEVVPPGRESEIPGFTPLRYQEGAASARGPAGELATVSVRHKRPGAAASTVQRHHVAAGVTTADGDTAFAAAVAEAALVLRGDPLAPAASLPAAIGRATRHVGDDPGGWRAEFVRLMGLAERLRNIRRAEPSEP